MGTELAKHLIANNDYEVRVWNRTLDKTTPLVDAGATAYPTAAEAVTGADVVITALFGPKTVRSVVIEPNLIPAGIPWIDTTTVSPQDAEEFAANVSTYIACPVVGTLGPARAGKLGVYVGSPDPQLRELAAGIVSPWADQGCHWETSRSPGPSDQRRGHERGSPVWGRHRPHRGRNPGSARLHWLVVYGQPET